MRVLNHLIWITALAGLTVVAGCGNDPTEPLEPVEASTAIEAAAAAADLQQIADTEAMLDAVESPLSTAVGDYEDLGSVAGGETGLDDYWTSNKMLARGVSGDHRGLVQPWQRARNAMERRPADQAKMECQTEGRVTTCFETISPTVVQLTITETFEFGPIAEVQQRFEVDTAGTEGTDDDRIRWFTSSVTHRNGLVIAVSMSPLAPAEFIDDDTMVALEESVTFAGGLVVSQINTMTLDVGQVDVEGDETIWSLSSDVLYLDGSTASILAEETDTPDGINDGDRVTLSADFTAAPSDPRLESASATVIIWAGELENEEDDLFESVSRTVVFDGQTSTGGSPQSTFSYEPAEPAGKGDEPCAGEFQRNAIFPADWEIQTLVHNVTHDCENGGSATLTMSFSDDTTFTRTIAWSNGVATLNSTRRNGVNVTGTFDSNQNSFDVTHTFPDGHEPATVEQSGSSDPDAGTRSYSVTSTYQDESQESLDVTSVENEDGSRGVTGSATNAEGTVLFDLAWDPSVLTMTGSLSGPDQQSLDWTLAGRQDGTADLDFTYADEAEDLTVVGDMIVFADGSGCGTLHVTQGEASGSFPVCFDANGTGSIYGDEGTLPF